MCTCWSWFLDYSCILLLQNVKGTAPEGCPPSISCKDHWRTCEFLNKKKLLCICMIPCTHSCDWKSICQTRNCDLFLSSRLVLFCAHYTWFGIINKRKICLLVKNFVCLAQGKIALYLCWLSVTATKKKAFKHSY